MKSHLRMMVLGAAMLAGVVCTAPAQASERLTLYEVNKFIKNWDNAVNNPDLRVGSLFLSQSISGDAQFETTLVVPRVVSGDYGNAYYKDHAYGVYYRYPYPYMNAPYVQEVSSYYETKGGMMTIFQGKKAQVPGYSQKTVIEGFTMPASTDRAAVDVSIKEYGARYSKDYPGLIESTLQSHAQCRMYLHKTTSAVQMTGMTCETISYYGGFAS